MARSNEAKAGIPLSGFYNKGVMQPDLFTLQMISKNNSRLMQMVDHINQKQRGKSVETASSTQGRLVLDPFDIIENGECIGTPSQYGVLAIQRNDQGCLRNSNELAVAFLSVALALQL